MGCFCPKRILNLVLPDNSTIDQKVAEQTIEHPSMQKYKKRITPSLEDSTIGIFQEQMRIQNSNNRRNNQSSNLVFNFEDIEKQVVCQYRIQKQQGVVDDTTLQTIEISQKKIKPQRQSRQRLANIRRQKANMNEMDIERMMQLAGEAHNKSHFQQQKSIYNKSLQKIQTLTKKFSDQSIHELKAYIYSSLVNIAVSENKEDQADNFVNKALQSYNFTLPSRSYQQRIALMNNYSIFKRNCGKFEEAKNYLQEAIGLMNKYYTIDDERRHLALINLACLLYEANQPEEAGIITQTVVKQCQNKQIVELAQKNQLFYRK